MGTPFTFVHAADLHLGTPFTGVAGASGRIASLLREATLTAFDNLVELCLDSGASFLVIAGDVYDGPARSVRVLRRFLKGVEKLGGSGIKVFVATGNHDPSGQGAWSALGEVPENLFLFPAKPASFTVAAGGETLATVHGAGYHGKAVREDLAAGFSRSGDRGFEIGVLHATVGRADGHEPYAPTSMETLKKAGLDYWALGHVHTRAVLSEESPVVVYPGNTQGLNLKETGPRGAYVVRVGEDGSAALEFAELGAVRFAHVDADASAFTGLASLTDELSAKAAEAVKQAGGRPVILTARLAGRTSSYRELTDPAQATQMLESLREEWENFDPPVWWNRLEVSASPAIDLERLEKGTSLSSVVLSKARELLSDPEQLEKTGERLFSPLYSRADARKLLSPPPSGADLEAELREALYLALDQLSGDEG